MLKRNSLYTLIAILVAAAFVLSACAPTAATPVATTAPEKPAEQPAEQPAEPAVAASGKVGIVLPTKDEPRWIQDEARFKEALEAAGYEVEILFSQGSSAKEKENVESLITKGIKVLIICPQDGTAAAAAAQAARDAGREGDLVRPPDP